MKNLTLILLASLLMIGCSKSGSKSNLLEGGQISQETERTPTDINHPGPNQ
ncbi:MAG: hypothetical protein ACKVQC_02345 [Elusimicrobiota bacterium]